MAFAEYLVIMAEGGGETDVLLNICRQFFNEKALKVNAKKCASLQILPVKEKKSKKVMTSIHSV